MCTKQGSPKDLEIISIIEVSNFNSPLTALFSVIALSQDNSDNNLEIQEILQNMNYMGLSTLLNGPNRRKEFSDYSIKEIAAKL